MQLAMRLGRTLDELGQTMSAKEFGLWCALNQQDPWDHTRGDINAAIICATIANYAGKIRKSGAKPAEPSEFMAFLREEEVEMDAVDPTDFFVGQSNA
jgi:hypothetical protein